VRAEIVNRRVLPVDKEHRHDFAVHAKRAAFAFGNVANVRDRLEICHHWECGASSPLWICGRTAVVCWSIRLREKGKQLRCKGKRR